MTRYILTGGPCIGKTTLIEMITSSHPKQYRTIDECARDVIAHEQAKEKADPTYNGTFPWNDIEYFQQKVATLQNYKDRLSQNWQAHILQDRSTIDSLAYLEFSNAPIPDWLYKSAKETQAERVFIPDRLPYKTDNQRKESDSEAESIHQLITDIYKDLGHKITKIPALEPLQRQEYMMRYLQ